MELCNVLLGNNGVRYNTLFYVINKLLFHTLTCKYKYLIIRFYINNNQYSYNKYNLIQITNKTIIGHVQKSHREGAR